MKLVRKVTFCLKFRCIIFSTPVLQESIPLPRNAFIRNKRTFFFFSQNYEPLFVQRSFNIILLSSPPPPFPIHHHPFANETFDIVIFGNMALLYHFIS